MSGALTSDQLLGIYETRYFSVAGLAILIYDHCLTFGSETQIIWSKQWCFTKILFLVNRYLVLALLIFYQKGLLGLSPGGFSDEACKVWAGAIGLGGMISLTLSNALILNKVGTLWNRNKNIITLSFAALAITQITAFVFMGYAITQGFSSIRFVPGKPLGMCVFESKLTRIKVVWMSTICFDLLISFLVLLNALSRPRAAHTPLTAVLYRDGIVYFFAILSVRALNLSMAILDDISRTMLGICVTLALVVTLVSRMVIDYERTVLELKEEEESMYGLTTLCAHD